MKKNYFLLVAAICCFTAAKAQYWQIPNPNAGTNPGGLNTDNEYPVGGGLPTGWNVVLAPTTSPSWSGTQTLPFSFSFNGNAVSSFKVSNSGVLTFDVASALPAPGFTPALLPNAAIPDQSVSLWGLGGIGANDNVVGKTFGTAPNRQYWIQFSSYGYGGSTASDGSNYTYWSIVLEETTNRIHIVDNRTFGFSANVGLAAGIQIDAATAYNVAGNQNLLAQAGSDPSPADNSYYTFVPGTQPAYNLLMQAISTSPYLSQGNNDITGTVKNLGTTTITSYDISYTIDGGSPVTATISGVSIAPNATGNFTHSTPWNATIGTHQVAVTSSNLNGSNVDGDPSDDQLTKTINVMSELVTRIPLFEVFTSSTCGPCAPGNTNYHSIVDLRPSSEYASIKYQQDFPGTGDPYATTETVNRRSTYYGITSIPRMMIDGGWNGNATAFTNTLYDEAIQKPAQFKMNGTWSINNNTVQAKVRFSPLFNATGAKLRVAILESVTNQNVKTNGETEFFHVCKKMMPNETGTNVPNVAIGAWDSLSLSYTFNGDYRLPLDGTAANRINLATEHSVENFGNLYVIAWIQASDKTVFQAANLTQVTSTGVQELSASMSSVEVFPNPVSERINVNLNVQQADQFILTLVDMEGSVVEHKIQKLNSGLNTLSFDAGQLAAGMYHLMIFDSKNNSSVHKINVQH